MQLYKLNANAQKNSYDRLSLDKNSEFGENGYDLADVSLALEGAFSVAYNDGASSFYNLTEKFNSEYATISQERSHYITQDNSSSLDRINLINSIVSTIESDGIYAKTFCRLLLDSFDEISKAAYEDRILYSYAIADSYIDAFYDLSRTVVFSDKNYNLSSSLFRESSFLKTLLSFAAEKRTWPKESSNPDIIFYEYDLIDPFAYDTLQRSLQCVFELNRSGKVFSKKSSDLLLLKLRQELLLCSIQSAFKRYVTLDRVTYRVELNRHQSKLIAHPYNQLSSSEETKPIRLFEKTAAYLRNSIPYNSKEYNVNVCVIGHSEKSDNGAERSLTDYVSAILSWYSKLSNNLDGEKKPLLSLTVVNYVNALDEPSSNFGENRISFCCEEHGHHAKCQIKKVSYEETFAFSTKKLKEIINDNQLVFLLDCPWLSTENYELSQSGSLDTYCYELSTIERKDPEPDLFFAEDASFFYRFSTMHNLDAQYNRIMSSHSAKAGKVVRSMRDDLIRKFQDIMRQYNSVGIQEGDRKELYILTSENDGIDYSYINSYPLTRVEQYDGKNFTIIQFKNTPPAMLKSNLTGTINFHFNLWGILKYICVSYAYRYFKEQVNNILETKLEAPITYFEIYRNILIIFDVSENIYRVNISVRFGDGLTECLNQIDTKKDPEEIKYELWKLTIDLIRPLYMHSVFDSDRQYGDDAIKKAFKMNLYSKAEDVNTLLFCHKYRMACERKNVNIAFAPRVDENYNSSLVQCKDDEFKGADYFKDKKLYSALFMTFERGSSMTLGMRSMLEDAGKIYRLPSETTSNIEHILLKNILKACEALGDCNSRLYKNAKSAYVRLDLQK